MAGKVAANNQLQSKLQGLAHKPGVYAFLGANGNTLYVGKASSLRDRVRSYFHKSKPDQRAFVQLLEHEAIDLETFVTINEKEAALLENELIKTRKPRYNIKLRDDKDFLSLRLDTSQSWPRLQVVRRPTKDGARYFGPYPSASSARKTLSTVNRYFHLRTCTDRDFKQRVRPCLQYQIKRCAGPCVLPVDPAEYRVQVDNVARFLGGNHDELVADLEQRMRSASGAEQYELAALYRDQIESLKGVIAKQRIVTVQEVNQDVFGWFRQAAVIELSVMHVRKGKIVSIRNFSLSDIATLPDDELVASFLRDYYGRITELPDEIVVSALPEASAGLEDSLKNGEDKVKLVAPQRGTRAELLRMAMENAAHAFQERNDSLNHRRAELTKMADVLQLEHVPETIESIDISHHQGADTSAVFVHLKHGEFERSRYRSFRVRLDANADDTAALFEVISRRLKRGIDEPDTWGAPDLMLIDGGKGQLNAALRARDELGLKMPQIVALAKERELTGGDEVFDRVYRPNQKNAIEVQRHACLRILAKARDEAHRSANRLREKSQKRRTLTTQLEQVPGIGKVTARRLLQEFGSLASVIEATDEQLADKGLNAKQLIALRATFEVEGDNVEQAEQVALDNAFEQIKSQSAN